MTRRIIFAPEAESDLDALHDYISDRSDVDRALGFVTRIVDYIEGFGQFPERGQKRDDLRPGLRVVGFERRVTIAFHVTPDLVVIDRVLYGGRDLTLALDDT